MACIFLEPNITHILNAQTPASQNSTTFPKTIFFGTPCIKSANHKKSRFIGKFCILFNYFHPRLECGLMQVSHHLLQMQQQSVISYISKLCKMYGNWNAAWLPKTFLSIHRRTKYQKIGCRKYFLNFKMFVGLYCNWKYAPNRILKDITVLLRECFETNLRSRCLSNHLFGSSEQ